MALTEIMDAFNVILGVKLGRKPKRTAKHRAPPKADIGRMHQPEMTGHVYPYLARAFRAAGVVHASPFLKNGVEFLPVVTPLEAQRLGER